MFWDCASKISASYAIHQTILDVPVFSLQFYIGVRKEGSSYYSQDREKLPKDPF